MISKSKWGGCSNRKHHFSVGFALLLISLFYVTSSACAMQQPVTVTGLVSGNDGSPLPGVNVNLKGTRVGAVTNSEGNYRITIPEAGAVLVFSYVGYEREEIAIAGKRIVNVTLKALQGNLDEVMIVGYGTETKRTSTGAIASLKSNEIEKYNVNSFQTTLQGRITGLEMSESSGVPGAAVNVRIRGLSSINGSSAPLYIVDGNPIFTGAGGDGDDPITSGDRTGTQSNPLTDINPSDIESVEVLKDAAATSIYGARGGAGVILITTKRGKAGRTSFNLSLTNGVSRISKEVALLNGPQLLMIMDEAYRNSFYSVAANAGLPLPATPLPALVGFNRGIADTTNIDHLHEVLRTGIFREINFSATNGGDKTKYYLNANVRQTVATIRGTDLSQYSLRANIDHDLSKFIRIGISLAPAYNKTYRLGSGDATTIGGYGGAIVTNLPIYPIYNADGTYFNPWTNPIAYRDRDLYQNYESRYRFPLSAYVDAKLFPGLSFKTMVQREDWNQTAPTYISGLLRLRSDATSSPFADDQLAMQKFTNSFGYSNSLQSVFTYNKRLGKQHNLNATLGMNFTESNIFYEAMYGENFANSNFIYPSQAANIQATFQTGADDNLAANLSYFARANYQYKKRYLAGLVINREGSSRFGGNKRFGTFPAASLGWIISEEAFLKKNKVIDFLKLRFSAGLTGNSTGIGNQAALSTWSISANSQGYMGAAQLLPLLPANQDLHWEKGRKYDAGLDATLFKNRITIGIDAYHYTTTEMLLSIPTPITFGYGSISQQPDFIENRGSLQNRGLELTISTNNLKGALKWRTDFNISRNVTQILDLGGLSPETVSGGAGDVQLYVGRKGPVYNLIEFVGVDPTTGGELIHDKDGNTVLASKLNADQLAAARKPQFDKLPAPKFFGGIGNTLQYKGFEISAFFSFRYGNYLVDAGERGRSYVGNISTLNYATTIVVGNLPEAILNRWTHPGQLTDVPKVYYNDPVNDVLRARNTTRFLYDASYIRLKNLQVSYTLPEKVVARIGLKSARINITGQNLFMLTKFPGADPEAINITANNYRERNIAYGVIRNVIPLPKTLTLGLNAGF